MEAVLFILVAGLASAGLSVTISRTHGFKWLRDFFLPYQTLYSLVNCHYCLGIWFSLILVVTGVTVGVDFWGWSWGQAVWNITAWWLAAGAVSGLAAGKIIGD